MTDPIRLLLVEDNPGDAVLLRETLREVGGKDQFTLTHVTRLDEALQKLSGQTFDVILLDLSLPDAHGLETLSRTNSAASGTPIVVLTGNNDDTIAYKAVQEGAQDYLVKGNADANLLARSLRYAIERQRMVAQLKRAREVERHMANHDALTGLPNRQLFYERLGQAIKHGRREEKSVAVMFLDLDDFKLLNDTLGHEVGDRLLQAVADRLRKVLRETDTAARLGGDEFTLILYGTMTADEPAKVAQRVLDAIAEPFQLDNNDLFATGSVGISVFPEDGDDIETMIRNADMAMYRAKAAGKNNYQFYTPAMNRQAHERMEMEKELRRALEHDEIIVYYQPQVEIRSGRITGMEALARWRLPDGTIIDPDRFIPLAEETGLIVPLGERVVRMACSQNKAWQRAGIPPIRVAVNLSARQLQKRPAGRQAGYDPVTTIPTILEETGLDPKYLELEITESVLMKDAEYSVQTISALYDQGIRFAIDDFGIGYSSLAYLRSLPIDKLKIDRSFLQTIDSQAADAAIVRAITGLAATLGISVAAEGVENAAQLERLLALGCEEWQGHYFSTPLDTAAFEALLSDSLSERTARSSEA
jgi:diguanylate cyclase (GGDEF)-like protein